jgi:hypothetical protein
MQVVTATSPLEQHPVAHRVDRGNAQGITHGGVGRRAVALTPDPFAAAELDQPAVIGRVEIAALIASRTPHTPATAGASSADRLRPPAKGADMYHPPIESVPTAVNDRDTAFFEITASLFASEFINGASVLLASYDEDQTTNQQHLQDAS